MANAMTFVLSKQAIMLLSLLVSVGATLSITKNCGSAAFIVSKTVQRSSASGTGSHFVTTANVVSSKSKLKSKLSYRNKPDENEKSQNNIPVEKDVMSIPVLGPIPGQLPLMVGGEMTIDAPTPMQWRTLLQAAENHQQFLKEQSKAQKDEMEKKATGIDAAPLVAIIDETTNANASTRDGRYATIAAVVGMSQGGSKSIETGGDNAEFMESVMSISAGTAKGMESSKVRLLGIGRASLGSFFYQLPTDFDRNDGTNNAHDSNAAHDDDGDSDNTAATVDDSKILVARFNMIMESDKKKSSESRKSKMSIPARRSSPAHALSKMSRLMFKIGQLHEERQELVKGLKAAKARLLMVDEQRQQQMLSPTKNEVITDDLLEDSDGLGAISERSYSEEEEEYLNEYLKYMLERFPKNETTKKQFQILEFDNDNDDDVDTTIEGNANIDVKAFFESEMWRYIESSNFGMGYTSSSVSTIKDMTEVLEHQLEPYYSRDYREQEEYYYLLASFSVILSLSSYLHGEHLSWSLKCTNTIERLEQSYEWMFGHKTQLEQAAKAVSDQLHDCGEECTDLF